MVVFWSSKSIVGVRFASFLNKINILKLKAYNLMVE